MSFSASALTSYAKPSLPSVESWGTNMNILRDPPKSIHTRRKDKVGDTSAITIMNSESTDRICESINVYARGVNPMVGVSYNNYNSSSGGTKLPYRIIKDGAFRPPISGINQTLALSRMPRSTTNIAARTGVGDCAKKIRICGTDKNTKQVKEAMLKVSARPTAVYKTNKPYRPAHDVKNNIKDIMKLNVSSGVKTMDIKQRINNEKVSEVLDDKLTAFANSNKGISKRMDNINIMDTEKFMKDPLTHHAYTNPNSDKKYLSTEIMADLVTDNYIQDTNIINHTAPASLNKNTIISNANIDLKKIMPYYKAHTNKNDIRKNKKIEPENEIMTKRNTPITNATTNKNDIRKTDYITTEKQLKETISAGSMEGRPTNKYKINNNPDIKLCKK